MSITVWYELATRYFEFYLEEKLDLLGRTISAAERRAEAEAAAANANAVASSYSAEGNTNPQQPSASKRSVFQLEGPLRQLPTTFIDASHAFVERLYDGLPDGYGAVGPACSNECATDGGAAPEAAAAFADADARHNPFLYGEVTSEGVRQVLAELRRPLVVDEKASSSPSAADALEGGAVTSSLDDESLIFVDLGSGTGKMVVEAAHLLVSEEEEEGTAGSDKSRCRHAAVGIELDSGRAAVAAKAMVSIKRKAVSALLGDEDEVSASSSSESFAPPPPHVIQRLARGGALRFEEGDFLAWLQNADTSSSLLQQSAHSTQQRNRSAVLFCCGVGFGDAFVREICDAIESFRLKGLASAAGASESPAGGALVSLAAAVLLFRSHPTDHPLYTSAVAAAVAAGSSLSGNDVVTISTSWMDEAPAMVLRWR